MSLRCVAVGSDLSDTSRRAFEWALDVAEGRDIPVVLVHVLRTTFAGPDYAIAAVREDPETQRVVQQKIDPLAELARRRGVELAVSLPAGSEADTLVQEARAKGAGLIAVGTAGRSGWRRLLVGSVAGAVVQRASLPVLAVQPEHPRRAGPGAVVVATEGAGEGERAIRVYRALFDDEVQKASFVLVHATIEGRRDAMQERLVQEARRLAGDGLTVEGLARVGDPSDVVSDEARRRGAELVALGARQRSRVAEGILGSTARRLLPRSPCPVLTLPLGEAQDA